MESHAMARRRQLHSITTLGQALQEQVEDDLADLAQDAQNDEYWAIRPALPMPKQANVRLHLGKFDFLN